MNIKDKKLKEILLKEGYVSTEDLSSAEKYAQKTHGSIVDYLMIHKLITKDLLGQAIAESLNVPYADLNSLQPSRDQIVKIPETLARKFRAVLFKEDTIQATVTTDNPTQAGIVDALRQALKGKKIKITYSLPEDIDATLVHYHKALETRFSKILKEQKRIAPEIITEIFNDALIFKASDIHFEPQEREVVIRFRVDGVMQEAGRIAKEYYENILNRIKIMAHLRTDEHFSAQDGSIRYKQDDWQVDMRVSIVPTLDGEKIVLRLLAEYIRAFGLDDVGLSDQDQEILLTAAKKPFGMILVTGPTGSGKTTTLYALLKILNKPDVNIATIEDPVEYKIVGVNHIQVNPYTNLTFAKGLRSIIRQDPDIILVGEIRDLETAEIAVNAALTGHLLLSTFHANDAATAIPRLLDMSIEPFLLASTLELIVAQRLVRKICESCRYSYTATAAAIEKVSPAALPYLEKTKTLYQGKGCATCSATGYRGRTAIFETIQITPEMEDLILKHPSDRQVWALARQQGSRFLFEDGIEKVKKGITSLEELLRVAPPPL